MFTEKQYCSESAQVPIFRDHWPLLLSVDMMRERLFFCSKNCFSEG